MRGAWWRAVKHVARETVRNVYRHRVVISKVAVGVAVPVGVAIMGAAAQTGMAVVVGMI